MADEKTIEELLAALDSDDLQARLDAVRQLGEQKAVEAIPRLIELLHDENDLIRMAAITALGDIGHISALRALMAIAREEEAPISILAEMAGEAILGHAVESEKTASTPPAPLDLDDLLPEPEAAAPPVSAGPDWEEAPAESEGFAEAEPPAPVPKKEAEPDTMTGGYEDEAPPAPASPAIPMPAPAPGAMPQPRPKPVSPPRTESGDDVARARRQEASEPQPVQFSAYYPREVMPDDWQPLHAYVFKESAADRVLEDAEKQLGALDRFRRILESARQIIREGETITATPNLPGFQFNPPSAAISFFEDWHRFEFKMRAKDAPLNVAANGFLTFTVNGIIVADIPLSVFVTHDVVHSQPQSTPPQPIYDTVFASYSRKDTPVVLKVEAAAKAFGMTYLRDVITLRSGENWSTGLEKMIDDATIFQIFWSPPYSLSQHCRREWEYAVALNRESINFIRPVYWQQPMPDPPPLLQHLHFAYQPDLVK